MDEFVWGCLPRDDLVAQAEAALRRSATRLVVLVGPSGVGKTHLLAQLLDRARDRGQPVEHVMGLEAAAAVPFGAVLHLLPSPVPHTGRLDLLRCTAESLRRRAASGGRLVLGVDDPLALDDLSAALIGQAVVASGGVVVATARGEDLAQPRLRALLGLVGAERITVGPLDAEQTRTLAELSVGGPVTRHLLDELWADSRGYPFLVRELLTGAHEDGRLQLREGGWSVDGPLASSDRALSIVGARLAELGEAERRALELAVLGGRIDLRSARQAAGTEPLTTLEDRGFVRVERQGRRMSLVCAHPLYAQVVRSSLPELRKRVHLEQLVSVLEASPMRRLDDVVRVARWRIECDLPVPDDTLAVAALRAVTLFDFDLALQLVRSASNPNPSSAIALAQAITLAAQGSDSDAGPAFDRATSVSTTTVDKARAVIARAASLVWLLDDIPAAIDLVDRALEAARSDPDQAALAGELGAVQAQLLLFADRVDEARATVATVLGRSAVSPGARARARVRALTVAAQLAVTAGDRDRTLALVNEARPLLDLPGADPDTVLALATAEFGAHMTFGDQATALIVMRKAMTGLEPLGGPLFLVPLNYLLAELHLLCGRASTAREQLERILGDLPTSASLVVRPAVLALLVEATMRVGDDSAARAAVTEIERLTAGRSTPAACDARSRATLWLAVLDQHNVRAANEAVRLADAAERRHDAFQMARWLVVATLLDHRWARDASERLVPVAARSPSPLVGALAQAVWALSGSDTDEILRAATRLCETGARMLAAEFAAAAAGRAEHDGRRAVAAGAVAVCEDHLSTCEPLDRSPLTRVAALGLARYLTRREHEVAALAAAGQSNREIAERLSVSYRTVENHLYRTFTKLNLGGRHELKAFFALTSGGVVKK